MLYDLATRGKKKVHGWNVGYAKDTFRIDEFNSKAAFYQSYFTLLVVTNRPTERTTSSPETTHIISAPESLNHLRETLTGYKCTWLTGKTSPLSPNDILTLPREEPHWLLSKKMVRCVF